VFVNAIYEPPQQGSPDSLQLERGTQEEQQADFIAERLGWVTCVCASVLLGQEAASWVARHSAQHSACAAQHRRAQPQQHPPCCPSAALPALQAFPTVLPAPRPTPRWRKVGWIFAQSTKEREFIMSSEETCQMAAIQVSGWTGGQVGAGGRGLEARC
jgi:hypothetical protein